MGFRKSKYTREIIQEAVEGSSSVAAVIRKLGLKVTGGNYRMVNSKIKTYQIDTSHFTGQAWSKGKTKETCEIVERTRRKNSYNDEEILVKNSPQTKGPQLKNLMIKYGMSYECVNGHSAEWMGQPLTLHVDHINGDHADNRLKNLRFLCPNCHQQTVSWGNKGKFRRKYIRNNPEK